MDRGLSGHLSWTSGTLYDWMKARIGGIDIRDGVVGGYYGPQYDGKTYFVIGSQNDFNRDFDRTWSGIAGNIDFYAHETRHADGFPHSSCCGIVGGCDSVFSESNPSAYAVQWLLNKLWLTGEINVGFGCLPQSEVTNIANWHLSACNDQFRNRFCANLPSILSIPPRPGGLCPEATGIELFQNTERPPLVDLKQNYPNPFNPMTTIQYSISFHSFVSLKVLNLLGVEVATLVSEQLDPGSHTASWRPGTAASGVYFYRLQAGSFIETKKLIVLR